MMNGQMIDIIFVIFLLIMAIIGYIKGFITRLYDLIGTVFVFVFSFFLSKPLSSIITIYQYQETDIFASMIGQMMNRFLIFVILMIILIIIKKILGLVLKPLLQGMMDTFALTSLFNHWMGLFMSVVEGIVIAYFVLVFLWIPFSPNSLNIVEDSIIVNKVIYVVPHVSQQVIHITHEYKNLDPTSASTETMTKIALLAHQLDLIDDTQFQKIFEDNIYPYLDEHMTLSSQQIQQLQDIFIQNGYNNKQIQTILSNIDESDE